MKKQLAIVLEPKDRRWASSARTNGIVEHTMNWLNLCLMAEDRVAMEWQRIWHKSHRTAEELGWEPDGNGGKGFSHLDSRGEGADTGAVVHNVVQVDMGIDPRDCRVLIFYSNGGGYAGGDYNPTLNHGYAMVGNHFLRTINGVLNLPYVSHEWGHSWGITSHHMDGGVVGPNNLTPDGLAIPRYLELFRDHRLTTGQKWELMQYNNMFLRGA